jgi:glycerophosphoryl diester phosphodiesterase
MLASYQVASRPSATIRALPTPLQDRPLVYAHRGGAALRPENTLAAFDHGLALGADGLELDVHLSRDGIVMVHHDADLDRTTDGRGPLALTQTTLISDLPSFSTLAKLKPAMSTRTTGKKKDIGFPPGTKINLNSPVDHTNWSAGLVRRCRWTRTKPL